MRIFCLFKLQLQFLRVRLQRDVVFLQLSKLSTQTFDLLLLALPICALSFPILYPSPLVPSVQDLFQEGAEPRKPRTSLDLTDVPCMASIGRCRVCTSQESWGEVQRLKGIPHVATTKLSDTVSLGILAYSSPSVVYGREFARIPPQNLPAWSPYQSHFPTNRGSGRYWTTPECSEHDL
jgi:hypothetical protein